MFLHTLLSSNSVTSLSISSSLSPSDNTCSVAIGFEYKKQKDNATHFKYLELHNHGKLSSYPMAISTASLELRAPASKQK